jgi:hypothetical protein
MPTIIRHTQLRANETSDDDSSFGRAQLHGNMLTDWVSAKQADKISTLIKAANVADVEPIWASLFAKVCTCTTR